MPLIIEFLRKNTQYSARDLYGMISLVIEDLKIPQFRFSFYSKFSLITSLASVVTSRSPEQCVRATFEPATCHGQAGGRAGGRAQRDAAPC